MTKLDLAFVKFQELLKEAGYVYFNNKSHNTEKRNKDTHTFVNGLQEVEVSFIQIKKV